MSQLFEHLPPHHSNRTQPIGQENTDPPSTPAVSRHALFLAVAFAMGLSSSPIAALADDLVIQMTTQVNHDQDGAPTGDFEQAHATLQSGAASTESSSGEDAVVVQIVEQENRVGQPIEIFQGQLDWLSLVNAEPVENAHDGLRLQTVSDTLQATGSLQTNSTELEAETATGIDGDAVSLHVGEQTNRLGQEIHVLGSDVGGLELFNDAPVTAGDHALLGQLTTPFIQSLESTQDNESTLTHTGSGTAVSSEGSTVIISTVDTEQENQQDQIRRIADSDTANVDITNAGELQSSGTGIHADLAAPRLQVVSIEQDNEWTSNADLQGPPGWSGGLDGEPGAEGGVAVATRDVAQSNVTSQIGLSEQTQEAETTVENTGRITAGADGMVVRTEAETIQAQDASQNNIFSDHTTLAGGSGGASGAGDPEGGTGGDGADAVHTGTLSQHNAAEQILILDESRIAGTTAVNRGSIESGGDGIRAYSEFRLVQVQDLEQSNQADTELDISAGDGGAGGTGDIAGGDGAPGGVAVADLDYTQTNEAQQIFIGADIHLAETRVQNTGQVRAGGDGIVAESQVDLIQVQAVTQENMAATDATIEAGDGGGSGIADDDGEGGSGGDAVFVHELQQSNEVLQLLSLGSSSAATTHVLNTGSIQANGDGIVARATAEISQVSAATQGNTADTQTDSTSGDGAGDAFDGDVEEDISTQQSNSHIRVLNLTGNRIGYVWIDNLGEIVADGRGIIAHSETDGFSVDGTAIGIRSSGSVLAGKEAIHAHAVGDGNRNIEIEIVDGSVIGGDGYYGVVVEGPGQNRIDNAGLLTSLSRQAIQGGPGDDTVRNSGILAGDVDLGTGNNALVNEGIGQFESGNIVHLNGGTLENRGWLSPGGLTSIQTTQIDGDWLNTNSGQYRVTLDMLTGDSDYLEISGAAKLDGKVVPYVLVPDDTQTFRIASASGGITDEGLSVDDTLFVDYELDLSSASELSLSAEIDIPETVTGLNPNQQSVHGAIEGLWATGSAGNLDATFSALLSISDVAELAEAYEQLSPEPHMDSTASTTHAASVFASDLLSCSVDSGAHVHVRQGECTWVRLGRRNLDQDATSRQTGFEENSISVSTGMQRELANNWHLGGGLGFERGDVQADSGARTEVDRLHAGAVLKYAPGPWMVSGSVSGGYGWHDSTRVVDFTGVPSELTADYRVRHLGVDLHAQYQIDLGASYLKPYAGLGYRQVRLDGFSERGGPEALDVESEHDSTGSIALGTRWGTEFETGGNTLVRPYLSVGATRYTSDETQLTASFQGGGDSFQISRSRDRTVADFGAGMEILAGDSGSVRVDYRGRFSSNMTDHVMGMRVQVPF